MLKGIIGFLRQEEGATAVEYGLLAALIAGAIAASVFALGGTLDGKLIELDGKITNPGGTP